MIKKIAAISILLLLSACASEYYYYRDGKKVVLTPVESSFVMERGYRGIHYYTTPSNLKVGIGNTIIVKLKPRVFIEKVLPQYQATLKKELASQLYLVEVADSSETLSVANALALDDRVRYAQPDFIKKMQRR